MPARRRKAAVYARFIPREELSSFAAWEPGDLSRRRAGRPARRRAAERAPPRRRGRADRRAAAPGAPVRLPGRLPRRPGRARRIQAELRAPDDAAGRRAGASRSAASSTRCSSEMAETLAATATRIARQVVRSELATRPEPVAAVAQEALDTLVLSARHITLRVHPDDHALVADGAGELLAARGARARRRPGDRARRLRRRIGHRRHRREPRDALAPCRRVARRATTPWRRRGSRNEPGARRVTVA